MNVLGTKRNITGIEPSSLGIDKLYPWTDLCTMLGKADYTVLCLPHTDETIYLIGEKELSSMKQGSMLINVARGIIIDQNALIKSLKSRHLGAVALDVTTPEPLPSDNPLWDMPNVIISPHSASTVDSENKKLTKLFCENLKHFIDGKPLINVLDKKLLY